MLQVAPNAPGVVRHLWPERNNFTSRRPDGLKCYTFLNFLNPVAITTPTGIVEATVNACYVYPPNTPICFTSHGPLLHNWFHFDQDSANEWTNAGLEFNIVYYVEKSDFITDIVHKMELEYTQKPKNHEMMIDAKIRELFIEISRGDKNISVSVNSELLNKISDLRLTMFRNLSERWTIDRMASSVHLSSSHFHSIYKKIYVISPNRDLINARIESAKNMLLENQKSISEISALLGYSNPYQFSHQFSSVTGISPREYIKSQSKNYII